MEYTAEQLGQLNKTLQELADEEYRTFHSRLIPNVDTVFYGVRVPVLRKLAKQIIKGDWRGFVEMTKQSAVYEMNMLCGMVIALAKCGFQEKLLYLEKFIPSINNWAVCDIVCGDLKDVKKHPGEMYEFIQPYLLSEKEYEVRFAVVILLQYFVTEEYINDVLRIYDGIRHDGYYVKMAVAWGISVCFIKQRQITLAYLLSRKSIFKRLSIRYNDGMDRKTLTDFFEEVETTEEYNGYFCSIAEAISIVVLGSLCGLKNVSQIHQWAESERVSGFLKEKFGINHIPCYYWLLVLLKMVKTDTLNQCLMRWAAQFLPEDRSQTTISLDGKTIRSTTGMKHIGSPLHIISAQICELGITLASETVSTKSNEIPAVQELLKKMDVEGCLVVADALNCQQKTAGIIVKGKGDYLLDAKGNQPNLEREISEYVQDDTLRKGMDCERRTEKNRDRVETRTAYSTGDTAWLYGKEKWENLNCIGAIKTEFEKDGRKTEEWHYYISSRKLSAAELLHHARMEWAVETMHWLLDVHYGEDYCRIENRTIQQNLNLLRKFSISLLKQYKVRISSKRAMSKIMLDCLLESSKICEVLEN